MAQLLSHEQTMALNIIVRKPLAVQRLVFVCGEAGTGKTVLLRTAVDCLRETFNLDNSVLVVAPTGVAAHLVSGTTVHSALRLNCRTLKPSQDALDLLRSELVNLRFLFVDEISMVSLKLFDAIDLTLRTVFKKAVAPFGGISVVVLGDPLQLSPVDGGWCFASDLFKQFERIELKESVRHAGDNVFRSLCGRLREGTHSTDDAQILSTRVLSSLSVDEQAAFENASLAIFTKKRPAKLYNARKTAALDGVKVFAATDQIVRETEAGDVKCDATENEMKKLRDVDVSDVPFFLPLALGSRVMLRINKNVLEGLVNGRIGTVLDIVDGSITVDWDGETEQKSRIEPTEMKRHISGNIFHSRVQFPFTLAWAINAHKIQGLTVPKAVVSLRRGDAFCCGLTYVVISRVRCLKDIAFQVFDRNEYMRSQPHPTALRVLNKANNCSFNEHEDEYETEDFY